MDFAEPRPLKEIIANFDAKTPMGSVMRSAEWQMMPQHVRDSAFFSAGVTNAQWLSAQQTHIGDIIKRVKETNERGESMWKADRSRFVAELRQLGEAMGIEHPDGPREDGINERDITDPLAIARLKLVVNHQLANAYGEGQYVTAMSEDILSEWPAWELVRITPRKQPRDWEKRWTDAGGTLHEGRMIALKTSPVWLALSRFGKPHPPFDFNSGMGVEEIDIDTAESFGLMDGAAPKPDLRTLQEPRKANLASVTAPVKKKLKKAMGEQLTLEADGSVSWLADLIGGGKKKPKKKGAK